MKAHTATKPFVWVKGKDGNEYICPKEELVDPKGLSDDELKRYCIDDADKPWND